MSAMFSRISDICCLSYLYLCNLWCISTYFFPLMQFFSYAALGRALENAEDVPGGWQNRVFAQCYFYVNLKFDKYSIYIQQCLCVIKCVCTYVHIFG